MAALLRQAFSSVPTQPTQMAQTPSPTASTPAADPNAEAKSKGFATLNDRNAWMRVNSRKTTTTPFDFSSRGRGFSPGMRTIFSAMFGDKERLG